MSSRGENYFVRLPRFGASLYNRLGHLKSLEAQYREIAEDLASRVSGGRLLDVGTGPGRLLVEIHRLNPAIELYGLDISEAMVRQARTNLAGVAADLRQGNSRQMDYPDGFFDCVTCTGSFYLWDHPEEGLDEIYRILKKGCSAYLYEIHQDCDMAEFRAALRRNVRRENPLSRLVGPSLVEKAVEMAYRTDEIEAIIRRTRFAGSHAIDQIALVGMPIWMRIQLKAES